MAYPRNKVNMKARTIKEISGSAIPTIPIGTEFTIIWTNLEAKNIGHEFSICKDLPIWEIWNDEFEFLELEKGT